MTWSIKVSIVVRRRKQAVPENHLILASPSHRVSALCGFAQGMKEASSERTVV